MTSRSGSGVPLKRISARVDAAFRCHPDRGRHGPGICAILPGNVERRSMIRCGADDRQTKRHVHRILE